MATKLEPATALRRLGGWLESPSDAVRLAAAQAIAAAGTTETRALARSRLAAEASPAVLKPLAESVLAGPEADGRDAALASLLRSRADLDSEIKTKLIDHLRGRPGFAAIAEQVGRPATEADVPPAFAAIDWTKAWKEGDPARGKALFLSKEGVSCVACHKFRGEGGQNGPSLEEADKRLSVPYVAESVLKPNAQVAPQYRPWTFALTNGEVVTGILLQEGADSLTVGLNDGTTRVLARAEVEERKQATTSIMPEGLVKTPDDLRDILAYLLTPSAQ